MMNDDLETVWKKTVMAYSRFYPTMFLERIEQNHETPQSDYVWVGNHTLA
jgi:hypothetical protein